MKTFKVSSDSIIEIFIDTNSNRKDQNLHNQMVRTESYSNSRPEAARRPLHFQVHFDQAHYQNLQLSRAGKEKILCLSSS